MKFLPSLLGLALLTACSSQAPHTASTKKDALVHYGSWGVQTQYVAAAIRPGDDFFRHINQGWLDSATLPPGFSSVSTFLELQLRTEKQLQAILSDVARQSAPAGSVEQQIADFHASYLDVARRDALGVAPLLPEVQAVLVADRPELARRMGRAGYGAIVDSGVLPDSASPGRYTLEVAQGDLGLPGRDYYLKNEAPFRAYRRAYASYITGVFKRAGIAAPEEKARTVLDFETTLARTQWAPDQTRDALRNEHRLTVQELSGYAPGFDWPAYLQAAGFGDATRLNVATDTAVRDAAALFARTPLETLRAYAVFHYLDSFAPLLSQEWERAHFDFHSQTLAGIKEQRPLPERALQQVNATLGEPLGRLYVQRYFPPESKARMDELVGFLRLAFRQRLEKVEWMDEATRREALAKLDAMSTKIGYPEKWHDYSQLQIRADDLVGNVRRYQDWQQQDQRKKLGEPVRQWEWAMLPQRINAYNNPLGNEVVFPAAILQAPFFDPKADPAVNFGAIGMVIGHEMGHSFDDQGSHYDARGALRNWWSEASRRQFEARTDQLVQQYESYSPLPGLPLNGQLTLGENIGDLGGMMIAWTGYQNFVAANPGKAPVLDGYTGQQRFFMGFAQVWRNRMTEAALRQQVLTNAHSPGEYRVNGVLANFTPWYEVFAVQAGDKLYLPENQRVSIW